MFGWVVRLVCKDDMPEPYPIKTDGDLCLTFDVGRPLKVSSTFMSKSPFLADKIQAQKRQKPTLYKGIPELNLPKTDADVMNILCHLLHSQRYPNPADSKTLATLAREAQNLGCLEAINHSVTLWLKEHAEASEGPVPKARSLLMYDTVTSFLAEHHEEFLRATSALVISHTGPFQLLRRSCFGHLLPIELYIMLGFKRMKVHQSLCQELRLLVQPFAAARPRSIREDKLSIDHIGACTTTKILNQISQWEKALTDLSAPLSILNVVEEIEATKIPTLVEATDYNGNEIVLHMYDRVKDIISSVRSREKSGMCLTKLQNSAMAYVECGSCPKTGMQVGKVKRKRSSCEMGESAKEAKRADGVYGKRRKLNVDEAAENVEANGGIALSAEVESVPSAEEESASGEGLQNREASPEL